MDKRWSLLALFVLAIPLLVLGGGPSASAESPDSLHIAIPNGPPPYEFETYHEPIQTLGTTVSKCTELVPQVGEYPEISQGQLFCLGTFTFTAGGTLEIGYRYALVGQNEAFPMLDGPFPVLGGTGQFADVTGGTAVETLDSLPGREDTSSAVSLAIVLSRSPKSPGVALDTDFNNDGCTNGDDLRGMLANGKTDPKYDLSGAPDGLPDGKFDITDIDVFLNNYDNTCGKPPPTTTSTTTTTTTTIPATTTTQPPTTTTTQPPPATLPFSDIRTDAHRANIILVAKAGVAQGFPDGTFRPGLPVTRGQMASFLARARHLTATAQAPTFPDAHGDSHEADIRAIAEAGITTGFGDGTFGPSLPVTREQMASFLVRAFDLPAAGGNPFTDISGVHAASIRAVAKAGIGDGFGDNTFRPSLPVTRGQMATFLARALDL